MGLAVSYACMYSHFELFIILTISCRSKLKEAGDKVTVFNSDSIKSNPRVSLGREGLFLMAILCGGDYDKVSHFNPIFFLYLIQI
jgi:hypothetical protein